MYRTTKSLLLGSLLSVAACGGGGDPAAPAGGGGPGGGGSGGGGGGPGIFTVTYTHTAQIANWEFAFDWFVEDGGALTGPFDSGGSGVVDLGQPSGNAVHLTLQIASFRTTFMDVPVGAITYYTGDAEVNPANGNVTVNLNNANLGDEMMLFYPFVNWWSIDQNPYSLTQSFGGADVINNEGTASVFVSYRASVTEEPNSRYDFQLDLAPSQLTDVSFDVSAFRQRTTVRQWQSSVMLNGSDTPYLWARRKGVYLLTADSTNAGTSGLVGMPLDFPADAWYLVSGLSARPEIVRAVDPVAMDTISMEPLAGFIDDNTIVYDPNAGTFSVMAPGATPIHFGHLTLASTTQAWDIYFPAAALAISGDVLTLQLPQLPGQAQLPAFNSVIIELYRMDNGATAEQMYRYLWDRRGSVLPSYAMQSRFGAL